MSKVCIFSVRIRIGIRNLAGRKSYHRGGGLEWAKVWWTKEEWKIRSHGKKEGNFCKKCLQILTMFITSRLWNKSIFNTALVVTNVNDIHTVEDSNANITTVEGLMGGRKHNRVSMFLKSDSPLWACLSCRKSFTLSVSPSQSWLVDKMWTMP